MEQEESRDGRGRQGKQREKKQMRSTRRKKKCRRGKYRKPGIQKRLQFYTPNLKHKYLSF